MLHMFAQQLNMVPEELIGNLGDVHIYTNHIEAVKTQLSRDIKDLPIIVLEKARDIFSYELEDIKFEGYNPHPTIKADISV